MSESLTLVEWLARYDQAARPAVCPTGDPHAHDIDGKLINATVRCIHGYSTNLEMPPLDVEQLRAALNELRRLRKDVAKLGEHVAPVDNREPMDVNDAAEELYAYVEQSSAPGQFRNRIRAVLDSRQSWRYRAFKLEDDVKQLRAERDGDVQAVVEACAGVVDGTDPQPIRHEYAVRRLRARFADCIAVLEACDAKLPVKRAPEQWCEQYDVDIADPDGWRSKGAPAWGEPITLAEFLRRAGQSTVRNVPDIDWRRIARDAKAGK